MKISALSKATGVSTASIKFYLREGLLPAGDAVGPRDAEYGEGHIERLTIIRRLRDMAHLPIATIKRLLTAADDQAVPVAELVALAHSAALPQPELTAEPTPEQRQAAAHFYAELGWAVPERSPVFAQTAQLLGLLRAEQSPTDPQSLAPWIRAAEQVAQVEVSLVGQQGSRASLVHDIVIGTYLGNQLLITLRMAAQINQAAQAFRK
ncbi:hypothetical protein Dxin01_03266 [Deinococcus xinjiangensis]|uniref:HTH merR-type domain-containing protein n=1 Tax=Deinococcus xinjiangensis TaxID=457454 RepID=A0ABP9VE42_9DEIO